MDWIGTVMGFVTIPMALFSLLAIPTGIVLVLIGAGDIVVIGLGAFVGTYLVAVVLERVVIALDARANAVRRARGTRAARYIAATSGILPMIVLLGWELGCFHVATIWPTPAPRLLLWLWSYGVATGPWTMHALRVDSNRRTVCGIRAYAGHIAYWLLSLLVLVCDVPLAIAGAAMLVPAILPITVGWLLAVASRDALRNVRI